MRNHTSTHSLCTRWSQGKHRTSSSGLNALSQKYLSVVRDCIAHRELGRDLMQMQQIWSPSPSSDVLGAAMAAGSDGGL